MPLTSADALELSKQFRDLANDLGNFRFSNWQNLTSTQKRDLEDEEWSLLNAASDMTTKAIGLALEESDANFQTVKSSVGKAKKAIKKLEKVGDVIKVATASVGLAAAIMAKDPGAIAKNAKLVVEATTT
ncbi:MAG: hypothetical protein AB7P17_11355 [Nitrospirales bacterium]|nr:hypothetical protein [Nitrospirales bacterium]